MPTDFARTAPSTSVRAALTRKRAIAVHWRLSYLAVLAVLLFYPVFRFDFYDAVEGSPTAYLLLLPLWIGMISYGVHRNLPATIIDDAELNWIVTVSLVGLSAVCAAFVVPELTTKAPLWHAELIPVFCIVGACGAVEFGVRRVARSWPVAAFVVLCFPVIVVLVTAVLGGTSVAYGMVALALGCVALAMALRGSGTGPLTVTAAFVCGALAVLLLRDAPPLVPMLVPAAVAPTAALAAVLVLRRPDGPVENDLPTRSVGSLAVAAVLALSLLLVLPPAPKLVRIGDLTVVQADWLEQFAADQRASVRTEQTFEFAPRYLGDGSSAVRYRVESAGATAFVDVFTSARLGPLTNFRAMAWYPGTAGTRIDAGSVQLAPSVTAAVSYNDASAAETPSDPVWVGVGFRWRVDDGHRGLYQHVRVLVSQRGDAPGQVPTPAAPSVSTLFLEPLVATLRRAPTAETTPDAVIGRATDTARAIVDSASGPGPRP